MEKDFDELNEITANYLKEVDDLYFREVYYCDTIFNWYISYWDKKPYYADFRMEGEEEGDSDILEEFKTMHIEKDGLLLGDVIENFLIMYGKRKGARTARHFKNSLKWKYDMTSDRKIIIPNEKFWALHFLFLKSEEFVSLFCNKRKDSQEKDVERMEQVLYFASEVEKFDNEEISYAFVYEKLTGINVALVVSDYLKIIFDEIYFPLNPCMHIIVGYEGEKKKLPEKICEFDRKRSDDLLYEGRRAIESVTKRLLWAIIKVEMPYTRIAWVNRIFYNVYCGLLEMKKQRGYHETEWRNEYTEECILYVIRQIEEEGKVFYSGDYNYTEMFKGIYEWFDNRVQNVDDMGYYILEKYQKNFLVHMQDIIDYGMSRAEREFFQEKLLAEIQESENNYTTVVCVKNLDREISAIFVSYILELLRQ